MIYFDSASQPAILLHLESTGEVVPVTAINTFFK